MVQAQCVEALSRFALAGSHCTRCVNYNPAVLQPQNQNPGCLCTRCRITEDNGSLLHRVGHTSSESHRDIAWHHPMRMSRTACLLAVGAVLLALDGAAAQSAYQAVVSGELKGGIDGQV